MPVLLLTSVSMPGMSSSSCWKLLLGRGRAGPGEASTRKAASNRGGSADQVNGRLGAMQQHDSSSAN